MFSFSPVKEEAAREDYRLLKHQMNLHQFNVTHENQEQALHLDLYLAPVKTGRLFPVSILLR